MGTILASAIVDKAEIILQDTTNTRWDPAELLGWLNDGQREAVSLKQFANDKNQNLLLVTGTKQTIPADGISLLEVVRNMGTNGATPGPAVRIVDREALDAAVPNWHAATAAAEVKHYVFDQRDPTHFYVYPPQPAANQGYVEIIYAAAPADIALGTAITLDDVYANAILDYILYRAYLKDSDSPVNAQRAANHYAAFGNSLGVRLKAETAVNPNTVAPPTTTAARATGAGIK